MDDSLMLLSWIEESLMLLSLIDESLMLLRSIEESLMELSLDADGLLPSDKAASGTSASGNTAMPAGTDDLSTVTVSPLNEGRVVAVAVAVAVGVGVSVAVAVVVGVDVADRVGVLVEQPLAEVGCGIGFCEYCGKYRAYAGSVLGWDAEPPEYILMLPATVMGPDAPDNENNWNVTIVGWSTTVNPAGGTGCVVSVSK